MCGMVLEIDYHSGVPIYRQVVRQIRRQILTHRLQAGAQLESVRDLAGRLKVNPMTISKAYSSLEAEGLLERRRGIGLFVMKVSEKQRDAIKTEFLDQAFEQAAITAIQLGVDEGEAIDCLRRHYRNTHSKDRSTDND